jgi:hypothetical protein
MQHCQQHLGDDRDSNDDNTAVLAFASQSSYEKQAEMGRKPPVRWTADQDTRLQEAVAQHGARDWKRIAACVGDGMLPTECCQHWQRVLDPSLRKQKFTVDEWQHFAYLLKKIGPSKWTALAREMPGRRDTFMRSRWKEMQRAKSGLLMVLWQDVVDPEISADELQCRAKAGHYNEYPLDHAEPQSKKMTTLKKNAAAHSNKQTMSSASSAEASSSKTTSAPSATTTTAATSSSVAMMPFLYFPSSVGQLLTISPSSLAVTLSNPLILLDPTMQGAQSSSFAVATLASMNGAAFNAFPFLLQQHPQNPPQQQQSVDTSRAVSRTPSPPDASASASPLPSSTGFPLNLTLYMGPFLDP